MAFTPGWNPEKQSRVARDAQSQEFVHGPLPLLSSSGAPTVVKFDWTNPSFALRDRQSRAAILAAAQGFTAGTMPAPAAVSLPPGQQSTDLPPRAAARAREYSHLQAVPLNLLGKDAVNPGQASFELPPRGAARARDYSIAAAIPLELIGQDAKNPGAQSVDLPPRAASRARDYSLTASFPLELIGQDATNPGAQSVDLSPRSAARARDYSITAAFPLELLGQDAVNPGQQSVDLPPRSASRARDYSITASFPLELIGQDALVVGEQSVDLPPRAASRLRDYTIAQSLPINLLAPVAAVGAQSVELPPRAASRARDYSLAASFPLELIGQDAMTVGAQSTDALPPRAPLRARDYSIAESFTLELIGQDNLPTGRQLTGPAPAGPLRASTLSETGVNFTLELTAAPPVFPCGQSTAASDLPPRAAARARDYSIDASFPLELVGKDQQFGSAGQGQAYDWPLPRRGAARTFALYDPGQNSSLPQPVAVAALPAGQQSTDLAPRAAARARDYSIAASFPLELAGKDQFFGAAGQTRAFDWPLPGRGAARSLSIYDPGQNAALYLSQAAAAVFPVGQQSADLPPRGPARAREYGQSSSGTRYLGKDTIYGASGEVPAYDWPNPRGPQRARDYTWLQSLPLYIFEQLPPGQSTGASELPSRGPRRLPDYTFTASVRLQLIGQDVMYGRPGEVPSYDWQLPTPRAARMRDYSWTQAAPYGSGRVPRDLVWTIGNPQSKWSVGEPRSKWVVGKPRE